MPSVDLRAPIDRSKIDHHRTKNMCQPLDTIKIDFSRIEKHVSLDTLKIDGRVSFDTHKIDHHEIGNGSMCEI